MNKGTTAIRTGITFISVGIVLLLAQWIGWDRVWPIFTLMGGLAAFGGYLVSKSRDPGLLFLGTGAVLIAIFFFMFSLGIREWGDMSRLWPVFPLIGGVSFLVLFFAQGKARDMGVLGIGLAALIVGGVGLAITHRYVGNDVVKYWPLLLVLLGVIGLVSGLRLSSRNH